MSKKNEEAKRVVEPLLHGIVLTEKELNERVNTILAKAPETLYKDDVVVKDKWTPTVTSRGRFLNHTYTTSDTRELFLKVITDIVFKKENLGVKKVNVKKIGDLPASTYNRGSRESKIDDLSDDENFVGNTLLEKFENYCKHGEKGSASTSETRLVQCLCHNPKQSVIKTVDYQIPTTNGQKDSIDLLLKKGDDFYITEVKTFGSIESFLRCVLEIETYYEKLNENFLKVYGIKSWENVKKAVLIDRTAKAWEQSSQPWAEDLIKKFNIKVFELKPDFTIGE